MYSYCPAPPGARQFVPGAHWPRRDQWQRARRLLGIPTRALRARAAGAYRQVPGIDGVHLGGLVINRVGGPGYRFTSNGEVNGLQRICDIMVRGPRTTVFISASFDGRSYKKICRPKPGQLSLGHPIAPTQNKKIKGKKKKGSKKNVKSGLRAD